MKIKSYYKTIKCLLGLHQWEKHIEWDNTLICIWCYKLKIRTDCCNAKIIVDNKREIRFCSKCKQIIF